MKIRVNSCVHNPENISRNAEIRIESYLLQREDTLWDCPNSIAYPPLINSHEHLISDWYPKAGSKPPYNNVDTWVKEIHNSPTFLERNKIWLNDGTFDLTLGNAPLIISLGVYKNIFSGVTTIQDHIRNQKPEYYDRFPINILKDYKQCHTLSLGNWWGGKTPTEEWKDSQGKMPFILHLGEGINHESKQDFAKLKDLNLLQNNTLIIHGVALSREEIKQCAERGTSICWCPSSNLYLLGTTLDVESCLELGTNVVLGTDSTFSGSINLFQELKIANKHLPQIPSRELFRMISQNAQKALFLPDNYGHLKSNTSSLLLMKKKDENPFDNLLQVDYSDIELLIHEGIPIYGDTKFLEAFNIDREEYFFFEINNEQKFVIGHPEEVTSQINNILGYKKEFPFLPF